MSKRFDDIEQFEKNFRDGAQNFRSEKYPNVFDEIIEKATPTAKQKGTFAKNRIYYATVALIAIIIGVYYFSNLEEDIEKNTPASIEERVKEIFSDTSHEGNEIVPEKNLKEGIEIEKEPTNEAPSSNDISPKQKGINEEGVNLIQREEINVSPDSVILDVNQREDVKTSLSKPEQQNAEKNEISSTQETSEEESITTGGQEDTEGDQKSDWEKFIEKNADSSSGIPLFKKNK